MNKIDFKNEGKNIEIKIYGEIGDYYAEEEKDENAVSSLADLEKMLKENKDASLIDVYINSTGGSVFDGIAIYNMLKRNKAYKRIFIEGFACSIASVIAMAGNKIVMPKSSMMMIHNAWCVAMGNAKELRKVAEDLDKINECIVGAYTNKTKMPKADIQKLMDEETYLTAKECLKYGFCTEISDDLGEEVTAKALDEQTSLLQNKLDTLLQLQNAIRSIDEQVEETDEAEVVEVVETEEVNEATEQVVEETTETANEVEEVAEVVQDNIDVIKENALKRFFNCKEEK